MIRLFWEEEFGNCLKNGLDVNFGIEIGNVLLLFLYNDLRAR